MKSLTTPEIVGLLSAEIKTLGSNAEFARAHGISPQFVGDVLAGRRRPSKAILDALGLERVTIIRKAKTNA